MYKPEYPKSLLSIPRSLRNTSFAPILTAAALALSAQSSVAEPIPSGLDRALSDFCMPDDGPPPRDSANTRRGTHPQSSVQDVSPNINATYWPIGPVRYLTGGIGPWRPIVRDSYPGVIQIESIDRRSLGQEGTRFEVTTCLGFWRRNISPRSGKKPIWFSRTNTVVKGTERWRVPDFISQYTPDIGIECTGNNRHYFTTGQVAKLYVIGDPEPFTFARHVNAPRLYRCTPGIRLLDDISIRLQIPDVRRGRTRP